MANHESMLKAIANHDADRTRLVADLIRASADMSDSTDEARLDAVEANRAAWLEAECVCAVLSELYGAICREPERALELVQGTHAVWREVATGRHRAMKAARGDNATCGACGVEAAHEDLREATGFDRGLRCEACSEDPNAVAF